jgi:hypothetical protein
MEFEKYPVKSKACRKQGVGLGNKKPKSDISFFGVSKKQQKNWLLYL